ncbi:cytochrome c1 [Asticcacaulis sp. YBE204]|uniref:cytochrome c1 n=1 Tax=Asticcacaulis sp. YBE204 TaxID=1282363 RepID=UPI0003C3BCF6|nr:cytochrome c1 [Asticcacaulis sp. YBE204]ESQ77486.1 ubiquinol cytochrome C oxidoreductase [Asticcacaulis sp. YBE204]
MSAFMTKTLKTFGLMAAAATLVVSAPALASGGAAHPHAPKEGFSFEGPFGTFDQGQLQRGYKVFREVCSNCHAATLLSFRNLGQKGGPFYDEKYKNPNDNPYVKQIASEFEVPDIDTDTGDAITRPATTSDHFPKKFANEYAARASNGGALPPDLSVITKARHGGARYVYSLLTGYHTPPKGLHVAEGQHYNPYMAGALATQWSGDPHHVPVGGVLAMAPPLKDDLVTFDDGTKATTHQMAADVATFLEWAGDPHATLRKKTGVAVLIYLLLFAGLTYAAYRKVWGNKH